VSAEGYEINVFAIDLFAKGLRAGGIIAQIDVYIEGGRVDDYADQWIGH